MTIEITDSWRIMLSDEVETEYEGARSELIAAGLTAPSIFEVGKSGTKSRTRGVPLEKRCSVRQLPDGRWRLKCWRKIGELPFLPPDISYGEVMNMIRTNKPPHLKPVTIARRYPGEKVCARIEWQYR